MIRALALAAFAALPVQAEPVVFAAASTRAALDKAMSEGGHTATVSYGASGTIARQIAQGAPADVFVSANPKWMDYLVEQGMVEADAVQVLVSNRLVLIAPEGDAPVALEAGALAERLDGTYFAVADPEIAPVGQYGKQALSALGLWDTVAEVLVPTRNTIATTATVERGEAALGLVYSSDAKGVPGVTIAADIPTDSHAPIRYLIAPVTDAADSEGAAALIGYLTGTDGQAVFEGLGFTGAGS